MITGELSTRTDLVEGLDADAIIDYLCHHGVLDTSALPEIDSKSSASERNRALLHHVESRGTTAVALFVNALRQSGQLHLASSLDTEPRIRPSTSGGYFGKGRHKGEVTVRIEVEWLKILAPPEPVRSDKAVDDDLLNPPGATVVTDDEDEVKSRCWCFCRRSKVKGRKKKYQQGTTTTSPVSSADRSGENGDNSRDGSARREAKKGKKVKKKKKSSSSKNEDNFQSARYSIVGAGGDNNRHNDQKGVIMEYDPGLELVKLRSGVAEMSSPTQQGGQQFVEQWRSWGPHFQRKASLLSARLSQMARDDLVKYFEQDRGTLVLDVLHDGAALCVVNICMLAAEVKKLQADVEQSQDGEPSRARDQNHLDSGDDIPPSFLDRLQDILFTHVDIRDFDIRGIKLRLALDKNQVDSALSELS